MPYIQLQFRRDTSINWANVNPSLASGEMGIELDTRKFKIGDGTLHWNDLPYGGLEGPTGPAGGGGSEDGSTGSTGATGAKGSTGFTGAAGVIGTTGSTGAAGAKGSTGFTGAAGQGVPIGGSLGQVLVKTSGVNYATEWATISGGGGGAGPQGDTGSTGPAGADAKWNFLGEWNPNLNSYTVGDIVTYLGSTYYCIKYTGEYEHPSDTSKWTVILESAKWNFKGVFDPLLNSYALGDIVTYEGSVYYCIAYTGALDNPATSPWKWTLIAEGGNVAYTPATSSHWASPAPTNIFQAIDRIAAAVYGLLGDTAIP